MEDITDKVVEYQRSFGNLLRGVYYNVKEILTMSKKIHTEAVDSLFDAILSLKNREECYLFFEDVCTVNEILSLSQRFEVAKMLKEKENLFGNFRKNRSIHSNHQPCKQKPELRK